MNVPYLAHVPFVLIFLVFVVCFVLIQGITGRQ